MFINKDLPISLEEIDAIADQEQGSFLGVWDEVQIRGIRKFESRVRGKMIEMFGVCELSEDFFCENKAQLALSLLYYLGAELMSERMSSSRLNRYTSIDRLKAKENRDQFEQEFARMLKDALRIINKNSTGKNERGSIFNTHENLP